MLPFWPLCRNEHLTFAQSDQQHGKELLSYKNEKSLNASQAVLVGGVQTCAGDNVMALDDVSKLGGFKNHNTEKSHS